jgi:hypothetical protein
VATQLAEEEQQRRAVAACVGLVISRCEAASTMLHVHEAAATLLQEPGDAAESICDLVLEVVPAGLDPPILGPASRLLSAVFNGPCPLTGSITVAGDLVHATLPCLREMPRHLCDLIGVPHSKSGLFFAGGDTLGAVTPPT